MIEVENLIGVTVLVGMAAGMVFGNLLVTALDQARRRRGRQRATAAWQEAWSRSRD